jgi:hypothetical protein
MDHLGAWVKCNCGDAGCRLEYPSGLGKFYQGTGFEPEEKELIIKAFAALEALQGLSQYRTPLEAGGPIRHIDASSVVWQTVPVEPTEAMIVAARQWRWLDQSDGNILASYEAMLAAAPTRTEDRK